MTELEQLEQDHAAIKAAVNVHKKYGQRTPSETVDHIERRIAQLEAEAADPWREAKSRLEDLEGMEFHWDRELARYVRHLESEIAIKDSAIVRLTTEAEKAEKGVRDFMWELKDRREELDRAEARIAELEAREVPPLDRARVWATWNMTVAPAGWLNAEPYPLQKPK